MARIPGIEPRKAGLLTRFAYWMTKRKLGRIIEPAKITAHHFRLLRAVGGMETGLAAMHSVDETLKALASIKAAIMIGCPF